MASPCSVPGPSRVSMSWVLIRSAGFSEAAGSCGTYATSFERDSRRSDSVVWIISMPSIRTDPLVIRLPRRA